MAKACQSYASCMPAWLRKLITGHLRSQVANMYHALTAHHDLGSQYVTNEVQGSRCLLPWLLQYFHCVLHMPKLTMHGAGYAYPAEAVHFFLKEAESHGASVVCSQPAQKLEAVNGKVTGAVLSLPS